MKKNLIQITVVVIVFAGAIWIWHARQESLANALGGTVIGGAGDNETYDHKIKRYRAGADQSLSVECSNVVVGLRRIVSQSADTYDSNFNKWTAAARVEYINKIGGVERADFYFKFDPSFSGEPRWFQKSKP